MIKKLRKPKKEDLFRFILVAGALVLVLNISHQNQKPPSAPPALPSGLTEDERFILNPPPADAPKEIRDKHAQIVAKLAKEGSSLEIKDCKPTPLVSQVKEGSQIDIVNRDNIEHKIIVDSEHFYQLPVNGKKTITVQFKYGTGDYGYVCEGTGLVGFLHITP